MEVSDGGGRTEICSSLGHLLLQYPQLPCPFEGEDKECKTYSGPNNDGKCEFPFTLKNGTVYDTCITTDDRCAVPWCPTEKHENAVDLESGSWGYCNHYCLDDGEA